jgi:hypothetical protein
MPIRAVGLSAGRAASHPDCRPHGHHDSKLATCLAVRPVIGASDRAVSQPVGWAGGFPGETDSVSDADALHREDA